MTTPEFVVPWESIRVPHEVDGSRGAFRAPKPMCALEADNDYQAISAWLEWHEAAELQRAYRLCRSKARGLSKREMICITYETSE
jgi:hypothetical protein